MKRCLLIFIAVFGFVFSQEPLQNEFSFKLNPDTFAPFLESWIPKPQSTASMWYANIPNDVAFSMQLVEIPNGIEYFIYPPVEFKLEDIQGLPQLKQP